MTAGIRAPLRERVTPNAGNGRGQMKELKGGGWGRKSFDHKFIQIIFQLKTWERLQLSISYSLEDLPGSDFFCVTFNVQYICGKDRNAPILANIEKSSTFWCQMTTPKKLHLRYASQ